MIVIYTDPNVLRRAKTLFIGCIFFDRYVGVFEIAAYNLFYSIEALNNCICAIKIFFFWRAFFKNLCYVFFDFSGRWGQLVV